MVQQREQQALVAEHGLAPEAPVPLLRVPARHQPVAAGEVHRLAAVELHTYTDTDGKQRENIDSGLNGTAKASETTCLAVRRRSQMSVKIALTP